MTTQRITELFAKRLSGEATAEELQELEVYLKDHPDEQYFQEMISNWWSSGRIKEEADNKEDHFRYIMQRSSQQMADDAVQQQAPVISISKRKTWLRIAAAAVVTGIISFGSWKLFSTNKNESLAAKPVHENEIVSKPGTKSKLILPDGTQVWLNSDSKLVYNSSFNDSLREVTLEGEAYFDVVKNAKKPFIVHTSAINIKVLGTAFNVKSYPQDETIEATLVRGLIEVEKNNEPQSSKILLHPNEKLVFNKVINKVDAGETASNEKLAEPVKTNLPQRISISTLPTTVKDSNRIETSWVYGRLLFDGDTFKELAAKMERWYNVKISFANNKMANYRFGGSFENENIEDALHALQMIHPFNFNMTGNEIVIDKK